MKSYEIDITLGVDAMHEESALNKIRSFLSALDLKKNDKIFLVGPEEDELEDALIDIDEDIDFDDDGEGPELSIESDSDDWDEDEDWDDLVDEPKKEEPPIESQEGEYPTHAEEELNETAPTEETDEDTPESNLASSEEGEDEPEVESEDDSDDSSNEEAETENETEESEESPETGTEDEDDDEISETWWDDADEWDEEDED
tara:strand:- start:31 stop:636 length:606 start_codon:yes stop_codon:yes gene_type:complete